MYSLMLSSFKIRPRNDVVKDVTTSIKCHLCSCCHDLQHPSAPEEGTEEKKSITCTG